MERPIENWAEEKQSSYLYGVLASIEEGTSRGELFAGLRDASERQALQWAQVAAAQGKPPPALFTPSTRARVVASLLRRFGPRRMLRVLSAMKVRGMSAYGEAEVGHPMPERLSDVGRRHRGVGSGGNLRAAVFGVNDGMLSNASLILGVAGAAATSQMILLSGVAGLLAGAFSMAAGEYVSVRSQREVLEHQIALERDELSKYPEEEAAELALIYQARGVPEEDAKRIAARLIADPARALDALAREELGLDPNELGSPWGAASSSFVSFAVGALVPLVPFLFASGTRALSVAIALVGLSLFGIGAALSLFTGRGAIRGGLRMLAIGVVAGGATFAIGRLVGVSLD